MGVRKWSVSQSHRNIHRFTITLDKVGDTQRVLCQSDVHWDNPHCNREMFTKHLKEARAYDAPILDNGDFWCAMQGKFDKRGSKSDLRLEHVRSEYLNALVETACDDLLPYADLLTVRGRGNHEESIRKRSEFDLISMFTGYMQAKAGGNTSVSAGGMMGFVLFNVVYAGTRRRAFTLAYHHGWGGGGPVTRGVIDTNRMAVYLADADLVWTGHTHDQWVMPIPKIRMNRTRTAIEHVEQLHFRTPGYKDEFADGHGGWHIARGAPPKPIGAAWLVFKYADRDTVTVDVERAK